MSSISCLNCEKELTDRFCAGCGQKADTHRITFRNFLFHDLLHGTFHIEKGILFTAKEALVRPGKAAIDYISGKRKRYYNVFYLILIVVGINVFLSHFFKEAQLSIGREITSEPAFLNQASRQLDEILNRSKLIICLFVPFGALNSLIIFRRSGLNLAEHAIISGMILLRMLLIAAVGYFVFYLDLIVAFDELLAAIYGNTVMILIILSIAHGYYNAFAPLYTKLGMASRTALFFVLIAVEAYLLLLLAVGYVTDWQFYTVNIINLFG